MKYFDYSKWEKEYSDMGDKIKAIQFEMYAHCDSLPSIELNTNDKPFYIQRVEGNGLRFYSEDLSFDFEVPECFAKMLLDRARIGLFPGGQPSFSLISGDMCFLRVPKTPLIIFDMSDGSGRFRYFHFELEQDELFSRFLILAYGSKNE